MSDRDGEPDPSSSASDNELSDRLRDLGRQIGEQRDDPSDDALKASAPRNPNVAAALRMASDFVAGVVVGAALGWGFDQLFDSSPWGLVAFVLLGFAAGVVNVVRSASGSRPLSGGDRSRDLR